MTTSQPKITQTFVIVALAFCALVVGVWFGISRTAAEKVATALALPLGLLWYLLICITISSLRTKGRRVGAAMILMIAAYTAFNNGFVAHWLTRSLESPYINCTPLKEDSFDVVVLLGGGGSAGINGRMQGNSSGDRVILAAELYHAGLASRFVCTGTRIAEMKNDANDPAEISTEILMRLGVPAAAISQGRGRTTSEEMQNLKQDFGQTSQRIGLVTSAWHLPRALRLAERSGLKPVPLPADFQSGPEASRTVLEVILMNIPQSDAAVTTARMLKEYMGMVVGR